MDTYDVVVIGGGPGGYVCAVRASQLGLKVCLVEKQYLGGVCLNVGCIPSKALLRSADLAHTLRTHPEDFGIHCDNLSLDYAQAVKRSRQVSDRLVRGVAFLMKKNKVQVVMGEARLRSASEVEVRLPDGSETLLGAKNIVLATGAHPMLIPGMEPDGEKILDYSHAILSENLPASAVIIGGGAIGVEFATVWSAFGVDVHIVEMLPHLLPAEDEDAAAELQKAFKKRGVKVHTGSKVKAVSKTETGTRVELEGEKGEEVLEAEITLVAVGFRPNTADIGLEECGVTLDRRGFVQVDERTATNVPGIWAIGDVTGKLLLAHTAMAMGTLCAEAIAGEPPRKLDYRMIPRATFTQPQVASFGYTEAQAREAGFQVKAGRFNFIANGKALGLGDYAGYAKILVEEGSGQLLGASIVGPEASELLPELTLAQANGLPAAAIAVNIHTHPTLSEAVLEAAEAAEGRGIHS